jgi:hypothetical protein
MPFVMESVLVMANVISGVVNRAYSGNWTSFEVVHIFPLESESYWIENKLQLMDGRYYGNIED